MPTIEISDEHYRRVEQFALLFNAVMNEDVDIETCLCIVLERGLGSMLLDIIGTQEQSVLLESIQQMAALSPEAVYPYLTEKLIAGRKLRQLERPGVGFMPPSDT